MADQNQPISLSSLGSTPASNSPVPTPALAPTPAAMPAASTPAASQGNQPVSLSQLMASTPAVKPIGAPPDSEQEGFLARMGREAQELVGKYVPQSIGSAYKVERAINAPFERGGKEMGNLLAAKGNEALGYLGEEAGELQGDEAPDDSGLPHIRGLEGKRVQLAFEKANPHIAGLTAAAFDLLGNVAGDARNWPLMGASALPKFFQKAMGMGFGIQMTKGISDKVDDVIDHWKDMDSFQRSKAVYGILFQGLMARQGLKEGFKGKATPETKETAPAPTGEKVGTVKGPNNLIAPTTEQTAGVTAPVAAGNQTIQQPGVIRGILQAARDYYTDPKARAKFAEEQTRPAATRQAVSSLGQRVADKIEGHNALVENRPPEPEKSGTDVASGYNNIHEMWQDMQNAVQKTTFAKADRISEREQVEHDTEVQRLREERKAAIEKHNDDVDKHNATLTGGDIPEPHEYYNPESVPNLPERPQTYNELRSQEQSAQRRASSRNLDAADRDKAINVDLPKATKAVDMWFRDHSDEISPAEYESAKRLWADSERYKEIAQNLAVPLGQGTMSGRAMRAAEIALNKSQIRKGQAPDAFHRLLGDDAYANWQKVANLFDRVADPRLPQGYDNFGQVASHLAWTLLTHVAGASVPMEWMLNKFMFNPAWGEALSNISDWVKDQGGRVWSIKEVPARILSQVVELYRKAANTSETGAVGAAVTPRRTGEPAPPKFGRVGLGGTPEFDNAQAKAAAEVKAQANPTPEAYMGEERRAGARPTMSATELEDAIKNRRPINNPFDQTEGARATMNRDPNMPKIVETPRVHPAHIDPSVKDSARLNPFPPEEVKIKEFPAVKGESGEGAGRSAGKPTVRITGPNGSSIELELDGKTARVKGIVNSGVRGDGQRLYDNAIEWAKDSGYNTFSGDNVQTEAGKTAWQRIAERHNARMSEEGVPHIDISGSRPQ